MIYIDAICPLCQYISYHMYHIMWNACVYITSYVIHIYITSHVNISYRMCVYIISYLDIYHIVCDACVIPVMCVCVICNVCVCYM